MAKAIQIILKIILNVGAKQCEPEKNNMNKNEFLKRLKTQLENDLSSQQIDEQIRYYDNYISTEIKNGRSESDILEELGDPILIAKTIKQVSPDNNMQNNNSYSYGSDNNYDNDYKETNSRTNDGYSNTFGNGTYRQYTGGSASCLLLGLVLFFIIFFILRLLGTLLYGGLYGIYYYPLFFLVILLIIYLVNKGRKR